MESDIMQETEVILTDIDGVYLQPLATIPTAGGPVLHMLAPDYALAPMSNPFGEIYFSEVFAGACKAWKRHKAQTQRFAVPIGMIQIVLFDARAHSPTHGNILELELGRPDHYFLLLIPPMIWYGFKCISPQSALICNYVDLPHNPEEAERLPMDSSVIPFVWPAP